MGHIARVFVSLCEAKTRVFGIAEHDTLLGNAGLVFLGVAVLAAGKPGIIGFYMATSRLWLPQLNIHNASFGCSLAN